MNDELVKVMVEVHKLEPGETFGEIKQNVEHDKDRKRIETIVCRNPVICAALHKDDFNRILGKFFSKRSDETINFLKSTPLYRFATRGLLKSREWNGQFYGRDRQILR